MIEKVTCHAVQALSALATAFNIPVDQAYYKIEAKARGPIEFVWFIEPCNGPPVVNQANPIQYYLKTIDGVNIAVEQDAAGFLINAVIDYDKRLLCEESLFEPTVTLDNLPVWPKGFVFHHQTFPEYPGGTPLV